MIGPWLTWQQAKALVRAVRDKNEFRRPSDYELNDLVRDWGFQHCVVVAPSAEAAAAAAVPLLLWCPECGERHVDRGVFADKPHHTHACQHCGHTWRPAVIATVGVQFLPGFKDPVDQLDLPPAPPDTDHVRS